MAGLRHPRSSRLATRYPLLAPLSKRDISNNSLSLFDHVGASGFQLTQFLPETARPVELRPFNAPKLAEPERNIAVRLGEIARTALYRQPSHAFRCPNTDVG